MRSVEPEDSGLQTGAASYLHIPSGVAGGSIRSADCLSAVPPGGQVS